MTLEGYKTAHTNIPVYGIHRTFKEPETLLVPPQEI